jgi:hypothetical protein
LVASVLLATCTLTACSKTPTPTGTARLLGSWEQVPDPDPTQGLVPKMRITFNEDGTFVMKLPVKDNPVVDTYQWNLDTEKADLFTLNVEHLPDGRRETMTIRVSGSDELRVEGKSPATFRRLE